MKSECDNVDAYLADDLQAGAATQFAKHVGQCETCRDAVEQQRWINALLSSDASAVVEPIPTTLHETLRASIVRRRHTARLTCAVLSLSKGGLAAAATVAIVALGWTLKLNRQVHGPRELTTDHVAADINRVNPELINVAPRRATFVSNGDTIAVPLESTDDNVTVVKLYPTTEAERRTRRELALQFTYSESNGG